MANGWLKRARAELNTPALSAAVSFTGERVWAGTAGYTDLESGTEATLDTAFRIGSSSKAVTSVAMGVLIDDGAVDLDAPISTHVPDTLGAAVLDHDPPGDESHRWRARLRPVSVLSESGSITTAGTTGPNARRCVRSKASSFCLPGARASPIQATDTTLPGRSLRAQAGLRSASSSNSTCSVP